LIYWIQVKQYSCFLWALILIHFCGWPHFFVQHFRQPNCTIISTNRCCSPQNQLTVLHKADQYHTVFFMRSYLKFKSLIGMEKKTLQNEAYSCKIWLYECFVYGTSDICSYRILILYIVVDFSADNMHACMISCLWVCILLGAMYCIVRICTSLQLETRQHEHTLLYTLTGC
jgi:hypothetical protein